MNPLRSLGAVVAMTLVFALVGCSESPRDTLVGTWMQIGGPQVLQFFDSGDLIQEDSGVPIGAHYRFSDDSHILIKYDAPAVEAPERTYRIEVTKELLVVTDENNIVTRYRRIEHTLSVETTAD